MPSTNRNISVSFTDAARTLGPIYLSGVFDLSIVISASASAVLQRSFDGGATWKTVKTYTASAEDTGECASPNVQYQLVVTGNTGTVTVIFGQ